MNDQLTQIQRILTCPECNCLYNKPIILPCGDRVCQNHLEGKSSIECNICLNEYQVIEFPVDKLLVQLLNLNTSGSIADSMNGSCIIGDQHKQAMVTFEHYELLIEKLERLLQDPYYHLYEVISQFRNKIDLNYERELISVNNYDKLLEQLTKFELERTKNISEINKNFNGQLNDFKRFKRKAICKKARFCDFNENERVWLELINEFEADSLRLKYAIDDFKDALLDYKKLELIDVNELSGSEDYNSFTNQFNIESIDMNRYFNLVFSSGEPHPAEGILATDQKRISYKNIEVVNADRTRATVQFVIKNFSEFMDNNECVFSEKFLFKNLLWSMSVKYTQNSNLSFYIHLCDTSLKESDKFSIKASIKPLEMNQDFYSFNDLYEKTLEAEFSLKKRSNGFGKYYFSNVDWLSENLHNLENDSITFEATIVDNQEIEFMKEINSILADLNPYNLDRLLAELDNSLFNSEDRLKGLVCLVYENAFIKYNFTSAFVQFSVKLANLEVPLNKNSRAKISFKKLLSKRCQKELDTSYQFESKLRRIRFFAELFNVDLLDAATINKYIQNMIAREFCEENFKCLSRLLTIVGKKLSEKIDLDPFFTCLNKIVAEEASSKCTFMVSNLYDLKNNQWSSESDPNDYDVFEKKLLKLLPTRFSSRFKKSSLIDAIELEFPESSFMSRNFIRALISCTCRVSYQSHCFDKNLFDQLANVLLEFIDRNDSFQMEILLAIEEMNKKTHPEVVLTKIFNQLTNRKIVTGEVLYHWKHKSDESVASEINDLYKQFYDKE